jgi:hypothetical protein
LCALSVNANFVCVFVAILENEYVGLDGRPIN